MPQPQPHAPPHSIGVASTVSEKSHTFFALLSLLYSIQEKPDLSTFSVGSHGQRIFRKPHQKYFPYMLIEMALVLGSKNPHLDFATSSGTDAFRSSKAHYDLSQSTPILLNIWLQKLNKCHQESCDLPSVISGIC